MLEIAANFLKVSRVGAHKPMPTVQSAIAASIIHASCSGSSCKKKDCPIRRATASHGMKAASDFRAMRKYVIMDKKPRSANLQHREWAIRG